jgi:hypothetical protein
MDKNNVSITAFMDLIGCDVITNTGLRERMERYLQLGIISNNEYDSLLDQLDQLD